MMGDDGIKTEDPIPERQHLGANEDPSAPKEAEKAEPEKKK